MRTILTIASGAVSFLAPACGPGPPAVVIPPEADGILRVAPARELAGVLGDPALGGRMVGTPGNLRAGRYLAEQFAAAALEPGGDAGTWFQSAPVARIRLPGPACRLRVVGGEELRLHRDFSPVALGRSGRFAGELAFAGYGRREDYKALDARGAVVLVFQGTAGRTGPKNLWWRRGAAVRGRPLASKLQAAADAGACAALLVSPPDVGPAGDLLYSVLGDAGGPLPAMRISRAAADCLLAAARGGASVARLAETVGEAGKGASFRAGLRLAGQVELAEGRGRNVIGLLRATRPGGGAVVIGAHYDHLSVCAARQIR